MLYLKILDKLQDTGCTSRYSLYHKIMAVPQDTRYTSKPWLYLKMLYLKILDKLQDTGCTLRYSLYLKTLAIPQDDIPQDTGSTINFNTIQLKIERFLDVMTCHNVILSTRQFCSHNYLTLTASCEYV
ncbi:hypothetical protein J6590_069648 [Homalodisca vitripennis]|nr:hypothetical protein J6590_069648 [Homalodisca vitripennis]